MLLLVWGSVPAGAVSPQTWRVSGAAGWAGTTRDSVGVRSDGSVALGLATVAAAIDHALTVWDLLPDGDDVLAATGDAGKVFRITGSGVVTEAASVVQPEVTCLGRDAQGRVWLGAAPDGTVYRLGPEGAVQAVDTPESYIWSIVPDPRGGVFLAAGDKGRIYRVDERDRLSLFADLGTGHVSGLVAADGGLIATTDGPGRLVRIEPDGATRVLYEAVEPETRSPVVAADGAIYFLANEEAAGGSGEARLYRREITGAVERIWTMPEAFGYDLVAGNPGTLYVTTGTPAGPGTVVEVRPGSPTAWTEVFHAGEPQVTSVALVGGIPRWIATGGLGRVYRVAGSSAPWGKVVSEVHDAGDISRWGVLTLDPGPGAAGVAVRTRSGNTRVPEDGWSAWQEASVDGNRARIASPPARFLQWQLTLGRDAGRVDGVSVVYLSANRAPRVNTLTVTRLGTSFDQGGDRGSGVPLTQQLPGGVRVTFETSGANGKGSAADDPNAAWARRYRTVTWDAADPNQDPLAYTISLRGVGEEEWRPLAEDVEDSPWVWDSSSVPDGWYQLRVEASDAAANAAGEGLRAARITDPVAVDNTPPVIEGLARDGSRLRGTAIDAGGAVRSIERAFDGGEWLRVFPDDGIPDTPREAFSVACDDLKPGPHVVLVRAVDEAGNIGTGRLRFELP